MRKIEEVMPLDIPRYLADTADLDNATSGAYLHALMHQWLRGPLPDDMDQCAIIMKLRGLGAKDIARAILTTFFQQQENASWIQARGMKIKAEVTAKAIRFSERATKANEIRWRGHVAKYPRKSPNGSPNGSPQGVLMESSRSPHGVPVVQVPERQDQNSSLRSSGRQPQAAAGFRDGEKYVDGLVHKPGRKQGKVNPPSKRPASAQAAVTSTRASKVAQKKSVVPSRSAVGVEKTAVKEPRPVDPRFVPFRREFKVYWKHQNPNGLSYGWDEQDGRVLNNLLRKYKGMDLAMYKRLLISRAQSDGINPAEAAARVLGKLGDYGAGPLDRYGRPK